jgi:hypothetical protein
MATAEEHTGKHFPSLWQNLSEPACPSWKETAILTVLCVLTVPDFPERDLSLSAALQCLLADTAALHHKLLLLPNRLLQHWLFNTSGIDHQDSYFL